MWSYQKNQWVKLKGINIRKLILASEVAAAALEVAALFRTRAASTRSVATAPRLGPPSSWKTDTFLYPYRLWCTRIALVSCHGTWNLATIDELEGSWVVSFVFSVLIFSCVEFPVSRTWI